MKTLVAAAEPPDWTPQAIWSGPAGPFTATALNLSGSHGCPVTPLAVTGGPNDCLWTFTVSSHSTQAP